MFFEALLEHWINAQYLWGKLREYSMSILKEWITSEYRDLSLNMIPKTIDIILLEYSW